MWVTERDLDGSRQIRPMLVGEFLDLVPAGRYPREYRSFLFWRTYPFGHNCGPLCDPHVPSLFCPVEPAELVAQGARAGVGRMRGRIACLMWGAIFGLHLCFPPPRNLWAGAYRLRGSSHIRLASAFPGELSSRIGPPFGSLPPRSGLFACS